MKTPQARSTKESVAERNRDRERTEEARQVVQDYIDDQLEVLKQLRRLFS